MQSPPPSLQHIIPISDHSYKVIIIYIIQHQKQPGLSTAVNDKVAREMIVVGTLNVGYISLTIQRKSDLKALSSEKMINNGFDYSHVIR